MRRFRNGVVILLACFLLSALLFTTRAGSAAVMSDYCQVPPFVISNVVPNVMLLVSNSASMLRFAYLPSDNAVCNDNTAPCGPYVEIAGNPYYGYFDTRYWYKYDGTRFYVVDNNARTALRAKATDEWDPGFLNWLTMRRIDVLRKALTGGTESGGKLRSQIADIAGRGIYKYFQKDVGNQWTPDTVPSNKAILVTFKTGAAANIPEFSLAWQGMSGAAPKYNVEVTLPPGTTMVEGVLQSDVGARARLGLTFFDTNNEGGNINPSVGGTALSSMVSRINTPSNINGGAGQPLAESLYTIAAYFAQVTAESALGLSSSACLVGSASPCNPMFPGPSVISDNKDPYNYASSGSRYPPCAKGFVVVIADGDPCGDGKIPQALVDNTEMAYRYTGPIPNWCGAGDNVAGAESVALWAHTTDLRNAPTVGKNNISKVQNLSFYVIQAFQTGAESALLKRVAINGGFVDSDNNARPNLESEYNSGVAGSGTVDTFFKASGGADLEQALRDAFSGILKRASSGTAASVLASGEGSGANLVQAVFYPRRRFGNDVIMWTGSLQNLWYYVDPYLANASIHEDTVQDKILALDNDYLVRFVYDTVTDTTSVALHKTTASGAIDNTVPVVTRPFEQAKGLWEAGKLLYAKTIATRNIFSIDNTVGSPRVKKTFTQANYLSFRDDIAPPADLFPLYSTDLKTKAIIEYVRGTDCTVLVRPRTVAVPDATSFDNVWKLGDIIHSTPRIAGAVPLNSYYKIYSDWTYKAYTDNTSYKSRGMVFTGGNDGMLHAFKLGVLDFTGAGWKTSTAQKAKLFNFGDNSVALGNELWAYVPRSALPYLKYLPNDNYCHLYYADLSPFILDASIGPSDVDQSDDVRTPQSWRTILIGGMRTGGACRAAGGTCNGGTSDCVKAPGPGGLSSYFALDITDPTTPIVLWEFSNEQLGFTTTGPSVVRIDGQDGGGSADRTRNGHWYVVFGSGPTGPIDTTYNQFMGRSDQPLRVFVLNLKTGELVRTFSESDTGINDAFAGSMINSTADFDLDYQDDAVFFGYVKKDTSTLTWTKGGVARIATHSNPNPTAWTFSKVLDDIGPVTSAVVRLQNNTTNTNWLYFGEGRYYYERDAEIDDASGQRRLYGIKDPCFKSSNLYPGGCSDTAAFSSLKDQTTIDNTVTDTSAGNSSFSGWYIALNADTDNTINYGDGAHKYWAERVITDPLSVNTTGTVFFTAYRPYNEDCNLGGKSFLWALKYNTGGAPSASALQGKALIQVSTAAVEQIDLGAAFSGAQSEGGRRSSALEGVPPIAQGLSILTPPPPVKKILHMKEH